MKQKLGFIARQRRRISEYKLQMDSLNRGSYIIIEKFATENFFFGLPILPEVKATAQERLKEHFRKQTK